MICLGDGCPTCQPPERKKATPKKQNATAVSTSPVTVQDPTQTVPKVDLKAAMKAAVEPEKSTDTSVVKSTTEIVQTVSEPTLALDGVTLSDEDLDTIAILQPILDEDQLKPIQSELWKRRRRV